MPTTAPVLTSGVAADEIRRLGYWPVVKKIMRDVLLQSGTKLDKVYLTGHSKGGAQAAQVSMWLVKEYNLRFGCLVSYCSPLLEGVRPAAPEAGGLRGG